MNRLIPGTTIKFSEQAREAAFSQIAPVLDATGGLTLSQLSKLSGLEGSTIQNWIKRGWVSSANGKKYSEKQVVRVLLINMLRGAMKLEDIARLMNYVNGDVEDTSDDIIPDITLYNILCRIIFCPTTKYSRQMKKTLLCLILNLCTKVVPMSVLDKVKKFF